jgi:hypothetical protein
VDAGHPSDLRKQKNVKVSLQMSRRQEEFLIRCKEDNRSKENSSALLSKIKPGNNIILNLKSFV